MTCKQGFQHSHVCASSQPTTPINIFKMANICCSRTNQDCNIHLHSIATKKFYTVNSFICFQTYGYPHPNGGNNPISALLFCKELSMTMAHKQIYRTIQKRVKKCKTKKNNTYRENMVFLLCFRGTMTVSVAVISTLMQKVLEKTHLWDAKKYLR